MTRLISILNRLEEFEEERVKIGHLVDIFKKDGFPALLFVMAIPLGMPLPVVPPINFFFGVPLLFISVQMVLGFDKPYVPKWVRNKTISCNLLKKASKIARHWLGKVDRFLKPRWQMITGDVGHWVLGLCASIMSLSIFVVYPMSNTVPSFFIAVSSFGMIKSNGLVMLIGLLGGIAYVGILVATGVILGEQFILLIQSFF